MVNLKRLFLAFFLINYIVLLAGCTDIKANEQAEILKILEKYQLHSEGSKTNDKVKLDAGMYFDLINEASDDIGFNLERYKGKEVEVVKYLLKEKSQASNDKIFAYFLYDKGKVIGGYLVLKGYTPSIVSLKDRSNFSLPNELKPERLTLNGIQKIDLFGPWQDGKWLNKNTIENSDEIKEFISLFNKNIPKKEKFNLEQGDKNYRVVIKYNDGPVLYSSLVIKYQKGIIIIDNYPDWSYSVPDNLCKFIDNKLK